MAKIDVILDACQCHIVVGNVSAEPLSVLSINL